MRLPRPLLICLVGALAILPAVAAQEPGAASPEAPSVLAPVNPALESPPGAAVPDLLPDPDDDLDLGPVSAAGQRLLDRLRGSVVQIRGFYGTNLSEAFHGSAFAIAPGGVLVTNYHVVSRAALYPESYRLEYHANDGASGTITILAVDVVQDLAIVRANGLAPTPLKQRESVPAKGDRAYAVGYPLNLGLVITEGIANGQIDNEFRPKLHYAGPMNSGMSGGPAVDSKGRVFGVNVSISTRGQLVSFLVPVEFIAPLLAQASVPLATGSATSAVEKQLRSHQSAVLAAVPGTFPTQTSGGYALPAELAPFVDCTAAARAPPSRAVRLQSVDCRANVGLTVEPGLVAGDFQFSHSILAAKGIGPIQFAEQLRSLAATVKPVAGSPAFVTAYACHSETVNLSRFQAEISLCVRSYRQYEGLYDVTMLVVSLNQPQRGFVSSVTLRAMDYTAAMDFCRKYLRAMRWTR